MRKGILFFKRMFPPLEDRLFLKILSDKYEKPGKTTINHYIYRDVCCAVRRRFLPLCDELVLKIRTKDATPEELVHRAVWGVTWDWLACGQYHVYRGVLSSGGVTLKSLWDVAVKELRDMDVFSDEDVRNCRNELAENIAVVG